MSLDPLVELAGRVAITRPVNYFETGQIRWRRGSASGRGDCDTTIEQSPCDSVSDMARRADHQGFSLHRSLLAQPRENALPALKDQPQLVLVCNGGR
jgi:hypothetical protein